MPARHAAIWTVACVALITTANGAAQTVKEPPPLWDTQVGASFVGTGGNSNTTTVGADFGLHRRWPVWQIESAATAVRTTADDVRTAERYLGAFRGQRKLTSFVALSSGERAERDPLAGMTFRSILDAGLSWTLLRAERLSLDGVSALGWSHERPALGADVDHPIGLLQAMSRIPLGNAADTTQRVAFYPDFRESSAYRSEVEVAAQAAMNSHLALKLGYLWRFSNRPVQGFSKSDSTSTASLVVRWRAATAAP